jgi:hypothetical protein
MQRGGVVSGSQRLILSCVLMLLCAGCATGVKWKYEPGATVTRPPLLANTVTVTPMLEGRGSENSGHGWMILVPLVLWRSSTTDRPDQIENTDMQFKAQQDIAKALADEIRNRNLFKSVVYSDRDESGELILRSKLTSTRLDETVIQYGFAFLAHYLWALGLPAKNNHRELAFSLELVEPLSQQVLWEKSYRTERSDLMSLWWGASPSDIRYDGMLKELMPGILKDLEQAVKGMTSKGT